MKIIGIGTDIIEIARITKAGENNPGFLDRVLTEKEKEYCFSLGSRYQSVAGRFASKEAIVKALGTGFGKMGVHADQIEILKNELGQPYVVLYGSTKKFFEKSGYKSIEVSLTHTAEVSAAICIIF